MDANEYKQIKMNLNEVFNFIISLYKYYLIIYNLVFKKIFYNIFAYY